ncbi:hypothetical protein ACE2AJ_00530 [Aquihabitans daechungensis]|uniref:ComEC/Rec2 family competence protein n=1 Tax=Aquihabitans daechungensis TaxID=1052257 RepID=UPI003B9E4369
MTRFDPHPADAYEVGDFTEAVNPADLVYIQVNVGDADTGLILLPEGDDGRRDMIVVDVGTVAGSKLPKLIRALSDDLLERPLLSETSRVALLVATHPHDDHIGGVPDFFANFGDLLKADRGEVWDPAYYFRNAKWHMMMHWLEENPEVGRLHPTAGTRRHIGQVSVTALSPSTALRNNFDTRGVHVNNASISTLVEFPVRPVFAPSQADAPIGAQLVPVKRRQLLLGADAQAVSWAHVEVDFPNLAEDHSVQSRALGQASGKEPLSADVFKVPHHASKMGLNLELVARIQPLVSIVSCAVDGHHGFPHDVALNQLREALQPTAGSKGKKERLSDLTLGILSTADTLDDGDPGTPLGTIALIVPPAGSTVDVWRFGDGPSQLVTLASIGDARRLATPVTKKARKG